MTVWLLAIDFGTSHTVAVLRGPDGRTRDVLFDGSPLLPSAVFAQSDGDVLTGRDAIHSLRLAPQRFEPNPKLRVDDGVVFLGAEVAVADLIAAVFERVACEARRVAGQPAGRVMLTHPAGWGSHRRAVLEEAAHKAGLRNVTLEMEPVAAARYLTGQHDRARGTDLQAAGPAIVYDFGGGTFDVSVVAEAEVLATEGLTDTGGLDIDAALIAYLEATYRPRDPDAWDRLRQPATAEDRRASRQLADDVRTAKEMLSRTAQTFVHVPLMGVDAPISREQVEAIAAPLITRTVSATKAAIVAAGLSVPPPGPVLLVGGASRMPLVATILHRQLKLAPTIVEQPELVVAHGALEVPTPAHSPAPPPAPPPPPQNPRPQRHEVVELAWTGTEPLSEYAERWYPVGWVSYAVAAVIVGFAAVAAIVLPVYLDYDGFTGGHSPLTGLVVGGILTLPIAVILAAVALARACAEHQLNNRAAWGLTVSPQSITITGNSGRSEIAWSEVKRAVIGDLQLHRRGSFGGNTTGTGQYVYTALHIQLRNGVRRPADRPAGWPHPWLGAIRRRSDLLVPICILGPMTANQRADLDRALARYASRKTAAKRPARRSVR